MFTIALFYFYKKKIITTSIQKYNIIIRYYVGTISYIKYNKIFRILSLFGYYFQYYKK